MKYPNKGNNQRKRRAMLDCCLVDKLAQPKTRGPVFLILLADAFQHERIFLMQVAKQTILPTYDPQIAIVNVCK